MAWDPLLLTLLTYCSGSLAQFVLTQPPSASESPEQTVMISCARSRSSISSYYVSWYQQKLGNVPCLIMHSTSTRPSGIPERFTGSRSSNTMSLTITGTLAENDADYYCSVWTGSARHSHTVRWGSDTKTSLPTCAVTLTQTSSMAVKLGETAELHCTLEGVQFINDNYPSWYQQRLGKAPRLLIYKSRSRASGIPERFSGDTYGNRALLNITGAQAEDEGDYYCAVWYSSSYHSDTVR
uniref:Ig-like domain-containing protein n=1 Tax=Gopherus agassizii TaxID=38772 RepID=A0A452HIR8_9SAUR